MHDHVARIRWLEGLERRQRMYAKQARPTLLAKTLQQRVVRGVLLRIAIIFFLGNVGKNFGHRIAQLDGHLLIDVLCRFCIAHVHFREFLEQSVQRFRLQMR